MNKVTKVIFFIACALAVFLYFVPAFRGEIQVRSVIDLGPIVIRWYGLIMALSILAGYFIARKYSWRFGLDRKEVENLAFWLVIVGIIGARIYYIIFAFDYFWSNPGEIYKLWHGGMSIYGAIIAGIIFVWHRTRHTAYGKFQLLDLLALSLPLSQAIGRFGNFFNQEAYGTSTGLPWGLYIGSDRQYHHPVFLYEAIISVIIFFALRRMLGKVKTSALFFAYLGLYSLGRFFTESIRVDSVFIFGFRADQVVAFAFIIIAVFGLFRATRATTGVSG